ncbi:hypothetical protein KY285_018648 [Solanum tuberosum]|nr:hypothetical protein KY285_018648 [Solanum tuberosum]
MKLLKGALKQLNIQHFRNIITEADEDRKALKTAQLELQAHPSSTKAQQTEKEIYMKVRQSSYLAEVYLQQQSKVTWLRLGDDNTRYFHAIIKHRRLKQATTRLKDDQGNWQTDPDTIANIFVSYYKDLLGRKEPHRRKANKNLLKNGNVLTIDHQINLLAPFPEKDVKTAMFSIDINKSPGPDGYGAGFFKSSWNIVGKDITEAVLEFFQNGKLLRQLNSTNVALIPKVDSPELASQYRPISCCNVVYKCISKMICSRLKEAISHIVANIQGAFVQGRHYKRRTTPRCLMKIDLKKAYDMVSWEFLEEALFTAKVNGEGHGYFEGKRGLRQGDPASPLLFLTHLIFADDLMIFCKGENNSVTRVKEALEHFSATTGLVANIDKSNIFLAWYGGSGKRAVDQIDRIHTGDKITERIKTTYARQLSYAGRLQRVVKEVDKKCREYLWGTTRDRKKVELIAWDKVCVPKKYGGLNIKGCGNLNVASVGKLIWQLALKEDSLWAPLDSSWYWRKLNSLKDRMRDWYEQGCYNLTAKGAYSISRSYMALAGDQMKCDVAELVWNRVSPPKHRFIMWLVVHQRFLTKGRLAHTNIFIEDMSCCLCDTHDVETSQHLFKDCLWFKLARDEVLQWVGVTLPNGEIKQVMEMIMRRHWKKFKKEIMAAIMGGLIYHTWRARNWRLYKGVVIQRSEVIKLIKLEIVNRIEFFKCSKSAHRSRNFWQNFL